MRTLCIVLILCVVCWRAEAQQLQPPLRQDHTLTFEEYQIREDLMQSQINLWELIQQLEYAQPPLRLRIYEEIGEMLARIREITVRLLELDQAKHSRVAP
jgi:hypothetical protein